jgi:hypothetical protein
MDRGWNRSALRVSERSFDAEQREDGCRWLRRSCGVTAARSKRAAASTHAAACRSLCFPPDGAHMARVQSCNVHAELAMCSDKPAFSANPLAVSLFRSAIFFLISAEIGGTEDLSDHQKLRRPQHKHMPSEVAAIPLIHTCHHTATPHYTCDCNAQLSSLTRDLI